MLKIPLTYLYTLVNSGSLIQVHFCNYKGEAYLTYNYSITSNRVESYRKVINLITFSNKVLPICTLCQCNREFIISKWINYAR